MTTIEWTEQTWNPLVGCSKISEGCHNCYAINQAYRNHAMAAKLPNPGRLAYYEGLTEKRGNRVEWTGKVSFVPEALEIPLKRKKPTKFFVNSMSDLFHESVSDRDLGYVFEVMLNCPEHIFQVLTKRPERMKNYVSTIAHRGMKLSSNIWLGVTVENQKAANERIPLLLETPAAIRFLSCEPLLEEIDIDRAMYPDNRGNSAFGHTDGFGYEAFLQWVIVGGESGNNARPCNIQWIRSIVQQCQSAHVPVFVKQLGGNAIDSAHVDIWCDGKHHYTCPVGDPLEGEARETKGYSVTPHLLSRVLQGAKGADINEFPEDLQIREFPCIGD